MELISERVLNAVQRHKRGLRLKSRQSRIQAQRERRKHHMASKAGLLRRARKLARNMVRERVAGKGKGTGYSKLGVSMKMVVDKMIDKYGDRINKLAKLLMPMIRQGEMKRMQRVNKTKGNVKLTGGVGKLHSSYEHEADKEILSERINDLKLDRLISAHTDSRNDMLLLKRLLADTESSSKIASHRTKILNFLDDLLEVITNDLQLSQRTESKLKSMNEEVVEVVKRVVLETLTTRQAFGRLGSGSQRRIQPVARNVRNNRDRMAPGRKRSHPGTGPRIGLGMGRVKNVTPRPKSSSRVGAPRARASNLSLVKRAASGARRIIKGARSTQRYMDRQNRARLPTASQVR